VGVRREPERVVIAPTGELDIGSVPRLAAAFRSADGAPAVVLDLRELLFLDTSGLRAVIDEDRRAVADGRRLGRTAATGCCSSARPPTAGASTSTTAAACGSRWTSSPRGDAGRA
jgi:STAS domain-containing protein